MELDSGMQPSAIVEAVGGAGDGRWLIRVIRGGLSRNRRFYEDQALREAAPLFEGARVFEKSDDEHIKGSGKSVRNLIGGLSSPRFVPGTPAAPHGEIVAELKLIDPAGETGTRLRMAHARGLSGLFGFSIDARGIGRNELIEGQQVHRVKKFTSVNSVDLIVDASAGGELIKLIEASPDEFADDKGNADMELREAMIAAVRTRRPDYSGDGVADDVLMDDYSQVMREAAPVPALNAQKAMAKTLIGSQRLPDAAKQRLVKRFDEKCEPFEESEVVEAVAQERDYLAKIADSGKPKMSFHDVEVEDRSTKVADMLDAFFDPAHKNHRHVSSFRECYIEATGDRDITGDLRSCNLPHMRESLGLSLREAVISTSWANALGDALTRMMLKVYAGETDLQAWRKVASVVPVKDFRLQERLRVGGYGNLPGVAEAASYQPLVTPGDAVATYAVSKRGGTETVSIEAIANDDVQSIRRIPEELGLAAANTLYEFVFGFLVSNPEIYDGTALFHEDHANLATTPLGASGYMAHRLMMRKQVRSGSGKRLMLVPKTLVVPVDLEEAAYNLFARADNIDPTFVQSMKPEVLVVPYLPDTNDWYTVADPAKLPLIEVGFLNGKEDPELFVQDMPNAGSLFSNDLITYKIRHIYGGTVPVDGEKAATKSVVGGV